MRGISRQFLNSGETRGLMDVSSYNYSGYLATLGLPPDREAIRNCEAVEFHGADLATWNLRDVISEREWERIPASRVGTPDGVRLTGRFEDVRKIDQLSHDDPSFWVPLGTIGLTDTRMPIDVSKFAVAEITYRCLTQEALPAWTWHYPEGLHFDWLQQSKEWTTVARLVPHFGFPTQVDRVVIRLYSPSRTTESLEIATLRFRTMTDAEREAVRTSEQAYLSDSESHAPGLALDGFMPMGTYVDAAMSEKLAAVLGVTFTEYWSLLLEDVSRHHHNCIVVERAETLNDSGWTELLRLAETFDIKLLPICAVDSGNGKAEVRSIIEKRVKPSAGSRAILAWSFYDEPNEGAIPAVMESKKLLAEADPMHPMFAISRFASTYPLYGPLLRASGVAYYTSHAPWEIGEMVHTHSALNRGNPFWIVAPAFTYATGTPEWSTCPEIRLLMNSSFANGARGWFTFVYHNEPLWLNGSIQRSLTGPYLSFSDLWLELDKRLEIYDALAPFILNAKPARLPKKWFAFSKRSEDAFQFPEGVDPTSSYRLRGPDYNLYFIISNDVRGMASVNIDIPPEEMKGLYIYDLTDCIRWRRWVPMDLSRHWEMFPGQARVLFVAERSVCDVWRDILFTRLRADAHRDMVFDLKLAKSYSLDLREIESLADRAWSQNPIDGVESIDRARALLFERIYGSQVITTARSKIIEVSSIVCACDGALCRLMDKGRIDLARELGQDLGPISAEFTRYRLDLRQGRGVEISPQCEALSKRALELLASIRSQTT
jgi:hypothetical protein